MHAGVQRAGPVGVIGKSSDQDGGNDAARPEQVMVEVEPAHAGQPHVRDQAGCLAQAIELQELVGAAERFGVEAHRIEQVCDAGADRRIIVDDRDQGLLRHALPSPASRMPASPVPAPGIAKVKAARPAEASAHKHE